MLTFNQVMKKHLNSLETYKKLNKNEVRVGVPDNSVDETGVSNVLKASVHENGSFTQNIPARPFARNSLKEKYIQRLKFQMSKNGRLEDKEDYRMLLEAIGLQGVNNLRASIDMEKYEPLSYKTIDVRDSKGTGTKILRDTDSLYKSFDYEVNKR